MSNVTATIQLVDNKYNGTIHLSRTVSLASTYAAFMFLHDSSRIAYDNCAITDEAGNFFGQYAIIITMHVEGEIDATSPLYFAEGALGCACDAYEAIITNYMDWYEI